MGGFTKIFEVNERFHQYILTSPVQLSANDDNWSCGTELSDLRDPLVSDILVRGEGTDTETHKEHIRLRIGQRSDGSGINITLLFLL